MNPIWILNRLRQMSLAEIVHRFGEQGRRRAWRSRPPQWPTEPIEAARPLPGFAERLDLATPPVRKAIADRAAALLVGRFNALGVDWPRRAASELFPARLWFTDPGGSTPWPDATVSSLAIDFRETGNRGDVKYVWELNRLQFLVLLAADFRLNGNVASASAIEQAIASWHGANPPYGGINWTSGIEIALRAISLILTLSLMGSALSSERRSEIAAHLAAAAQWLGAFPSLHSSANNHRVAELAGLSLIAFATGAEPQVALSDLATELSRQILPDGSPAEQSPTYGAFTVELALLCRRVALDHGLAIPAGLDDRLAAFSRFAAVLGDEALVSAGDDDEGRVIADLAEIGFYPGQIGRIAGLAALSGPSGDLRSLLLGGALAPGPPPPGLTTFPEGGLSIWRGEVAGRSARLGFDHGPLGYLSIAAHGHADALSFTLAIDGEPVFIDPGTYLYGSGKAWRSWFRSTPAHNTLNLESENQSQMTGPFNWSRKARTRLLEATADPLRLLAEHDGYERRHGVRHRREITATATGWRLVDSLSGALPQVAELVFQLAPGCEIAAEGPALVVRRHGTPLLNLFLPQGELALAIGGPGPSGGWASPRFGLIVAAPRLTWRGKVGPSGVETRIELIGSVS